MSGEQEHVAQLDRGDRDRVCIAPFVDDLRQRRDRSRRARTRARLPHLEQDCAAVVGSRRLVERAREQRGRTGCVPQREGVARCRSEQRHGPAVPGGLGMHDLSGDLPTRGLALPENRSRGVVTALALGR